MTTEISPLPEPTGNIWKPDRTNPATVPISTKLVMTHIKGPFREKERKLWTFLVHAVWDNLQADQVHQLPLNEVNRVFRELGGRHDSKWLKDYLVSIAETTMRFQGQSENKKIWMVSNLISSASIVQEVNQYGEEEDFLRFSFPPDLIEALKSRRLFTRLRPHLMLTLSGKYTVSLYEMLESIVNQKQPTFKASVEELRRYLAVPEGKLKAWRDFQRYAIKPAVTELNKHSEDTGFTISYELIKGHKNKILEIHFFVEKVASRKEFERKISKRRITPKVVTENINLPLFSGADYDKIRHTLDSNGFQKYDLHSLEEDWRREYESKAKGIKSPTGHFIAFCKRRLEKQQPQGLFQSLFGRFTANG